MSSLVLPPKSRLRLALQHMASLIRGVPGVGHVYTFWRHTKDPELYVARYVSAAMGSGDQVNAWILWREKTRTEWQKDRDWRTDFHTIVVRGILAFSEPTKVDQEDEEVGTGATFTDIVEAVRGLADREQNRWHTLGGSGAYEQPEAWVKCSPLSCDVEDLRAFGQNLAHYCELRCTYEVRKMAPSRDGMGL